MMESNVILNERGDEVVTMVVALLITQSEWLPSRLTGLFEILQNINSNIR